MNTLITENTSNANGSTYRSLNILVETKSINIIIVTGSTERVTVQVNNASQRVWRGMGKDFSDLNEALNNYKDKKVRAAIIAAQDLIYFESNPATAQA